MRPATIAPSADRSVSTTVRRPTEGAGIAAEERFEEQKHKQVYSKIRKEDLRMEPSDWTRFDGCTIPHPNPYFESVLRLGDVRDKTVLDAGCGDGWLSVILAKRGAAHVDAFDISEVAVRLAKARAEMNGVAGRVTVEHGSMYDIPWPASHYDVIAGQGILHHVRDKELCAKELHRVLKPGGVAVFKEPLGESPFLQRLRRFVPVASDAPEDPDHWKDQITLAQLDPFRELFDVTWRVHHLFSRLEKVLPFKRLVSWIADLDMMLLRRVPFLRRYARSIVIELRPRSV